MPELSTLLRQRLGATVDRASQHPDADLLTAYVEELLPAHEHDHVVQHLSLCSQCREVVALTTPEMVAAPEAQAEVATPPVLSVPARRWFLSPAFGLAGSIAAMVLGVALILRLPLTTKQNATSNATQPIQEAKVPTAAAPSISNGPVSQSSGAASLPLMAQQQPAPAAAPTLEAKAESGPSRAGLRYGAPIRRTTAVQDSKPAAPAPVFTAEVQKQDYVNKMFLASSSESPAAAPVFRDLPQAPVPVQPNVFFGPPAAVAGNGYQSSDAFEVSSNAAGKNRGIVTFNSSYSSERQGIRGTALLDKIVEFGRRPLTRRPGAPISSGSVKTSAMFRPGVAAAHSADAITAKKEPVEGGVLAQSQAFSGNALAALPRRQMLGAPQYQWKVVQGKLLRSSDNNHWTEENAAGEGVEFSVVSSNGPEIWAGGSQAALLHSPDAGTTWERITLGAAAVGTINSIETAGQNVRVKSSSGQSWSSQDGGRSWTLLE